jgi:hypothetical protein
MVNLENVCLFRLGLNWSLLLWLNYIAINLLTGHLFNPTLGHIVGALQKKESGSDFY